MNYGSYNRSRRRGFLEYCFDYWWAILLLFIIAIITLIEVYTEERQIGATVIEHHVVGHQHRTEYSTLVQTDDGYLQTLSDLNSYVVPVNGRVWITKRVMKRDRP
jgi:hypothetical protein